VIVSAFWNCLATRERIGHRVVMVSEMELDLDQLFEFGLGRLLDGLERYLAGR